MMDNATSVSKWEPVKFPLELALGLRLAVARGKYVIERQMSQDDWCPETWSENLSGMIVSLAWLTPRLSTNIEAAIMRAPALPPD